MTRTETSAPEGRMRHTIARGRPLKVLALLLCAAAMLCGGIAGCYYTLGTTLPRDLRTVYVPIFANKSKESRIENEATRAARSEFQRDGTLRLADAEDADLVLTATLVDYSLQAISYQRNRPKVTREYRVVLTADIVLKRTHPQKELFTRRVTGDTTFEVGADLTVAKTEALPAAAKILARNIVEAVVQMW